MTRLLDATRKAARPIRGASEIRAACVLGSVARGEPDERSDIDLLVVTTAHDSRSARAIRAMLPAQIGGHRLQTRLVTAERIEEIREARTVYAAHVATEGVILFDRRRDLRRLQKAFPAGSTVAESGAKLRYRLRLYDDLAWCNGHYLACFADLYAFGRAGAILSLARNGIFEFGRTAPFDVLARIDPSLAEASATLRMLEPFYLRGRRSAAISLPFPSRNAHGSAERARDACRGILASVP